MLLVFCGFFNFYSLRLFMIFVKVILFVFLKPAIEKFECPATSASPRFTCHYITQGLYQRDYFFWNVRVIVMYTCIYHNYA